MDSLSTSNSVVEVGQHPDPGTAALPAHDDDILFLLGADSVERSTPVAASQISPADAPSQRALDIIVAGGVLLLMLPLIVLCALAVRLSGAGPVIYRQTRIGRNGREFTCLKFRTMVCGADAAIAALLQQSQETNDEWLAAHKIRNDPRVTRVGQFFRRYSLDELPQLFNVLAGHMSVVGPRPIVSAEIHRYGLKFADYCSVKPGLTGLWQVSGRHALAYSVRVDLDSAYARSKSLSADLLILVRTVPVVLFGQNG